MTRNLQHGPSQARPAQAPVAGGPLGHSLRHPAGLLALEDDCLDDPNLRRIDAFLADDGLDDTSDEI